MKWFIIILIFALLATLQNALPSTTAGATTTPDTTINSAEASVVQIPTQMPLSTIKPLPTLEPAPSPTPQATLEPTPIPTPKATVVPMPSSTPKPTATPMPSSTPKPTPKPTPEPTATPVPSSTPIPTPKPTATPMPSSTPMPTPKPTPEPTPVPTPTPEPVAKTLTVDGEYQKVVIYTVEQSFEQHILKAINEARVREGLSELIMDSTLTKLARIKSADMIANAYFSHESPIYGRPKDMMNLFNIPYRYLGENLQYTSVFCPEQIHSRLMNSAGHKANILKPEYGRVGIGVLSHKGLVYTTEIFMQS